MMGLPFRASCDDYPRCAIPGEARQPMLRMYKLLMREAKGELESSELPSALASLFTAASLNLNTKPSCVDTMVNDVCTMYMYMRTGSASFPSAAASATSASAALRAPASVLTVAVGAAAGALLRRLLLHLLRLGLHPVVLSLLRGLLAVLLVPLSLPLGLPPRPLPRVVVLQAPLPLDLGGLLPLPFLLPS